MSNSSRLVSLDVFRGLTIVLMIIVNSPGNNTPYTFLQHSVWNGCTLADLVFPWFIFIVGISAVLSLSAKQLKNLSNVQLGYFILKRSIIIFSLGLLLNALPYHFDVHSIRILGVLQRIALCYLFSAIMFLTTKPSTNLLVILAILLGYWFILAYFGEACVAKIDQLLLGSQHLYRPEYDPEGLLSTLPCFALVLLGNLIGIRLETIESTHQKLRDLLLISLIILALGGLFGQWQAFNKTLMTSSTVIWTSGLGLLVFCLLYFLIEVKHQVRWAKPLQLFGNNALLIYVLHVIGLKIQTFILLPNSSGQLINLKLYVTEQAFFWTSTRNAALLYALGYLLLCYWILKFFRTRLIPVYLKTHRQWID